MERTLKIAILGAGNVGRALGSVWASKGHEITFGVPEPQSERVERTLAAIEGNRRAATNRQATSLAEVVALSVPWSAAEDAVKSAGDLSGKVLIDCTNPISADLKGLSIGLTTSAAEQVAEWAPGAKVVKAFNTIGAINFGKTQFGADRADGFYCGNENDAKQIAKKLIEDVGLEPVDVGPLRNARFLEPLAMLWIDLAVNQRQGPDHAFKLLRR